MNKTLIALTLTSAVVTGAIADGKAEYTNAGCTACHGVNGKSIAPNYPNLAGQNAAYIVKQLKDFQSGARKDPTMSAMAPLVAGKEQAIADYVSSLK